MSDKTETTIIDPMNFTNSFKVDELTPLLNHECIRKEHRKQLPKPSVEVIGIVCGILTMNSEVEILIQFPEGMEQLCKREFQANFIIVEDLD